MMLVATLITPTMSVITAKKLAFEHRGRPEEETIGNGSLSVTG
jgi:hypothetical protein